MLILSRKWEERVVIRTPDGQEVWLTILPDFRGRNRARIGVVAPDDWSVDREEIYHARRRLATAATAAQQATTGQGGPIESPAGDEVAPTVGDAPGEPG